MTTMMLQMGGLRHARHGRQAKGARAVALCVVLVAGLHGPAIAAEPDPRQVAVPYYTPAAFVQGLVAHHHLPRARHLEQESQALVARLQAVCAAPGAGAAASPLVEARRQWTAALSAWSGLSAVAVGPLVQRRSIRQIDFQPVRPPLVGKAIGQGLGRIEDLEAVGSPAKGLPALEWLLWANAPLPPASAACRYAVLVAGDVAREAQALRAGFEALQSHDWAEDEAGAVALTGEVVNQWVGAVEALRWRELGKPLNSAPPGQAPAYARPFSQQATVAWAAQWEAIAAVAVQQGRPVAQPGAGLVPLETYLRGRGRNREADALAAAAERAGRAVRALTSSSSAGGPPPAARVRPAVAELAALKNTLEEVVAPALQISIGFSDADGD